MSLQPPHLDEINSHPLVRQQHMQTQVFAIYEVVRYFNGTSEEGQIHDMPFGNVSLAVEDHGTTALKAEVTKLHGQTQIR